MTNMLSDPKEYLLFKEERRKGIGSSDAPSICEAEGAFNTPFEVWEQKIYGTENEDNWAMKRGRDKEEEARQWFEKEMGCILLPKTVVHSTHHWIRANLDGMDLDGQIVVEIKILGKEDHDNAKAGKIPLKYWIQCQHQLMALETIPHMYYLSYDVKEKAGFIVEVAPDEDFMEETLFPKELQFWNYVTTKTPPPLTDRDFLNMQGNSNFMELTEVHCKIKILEEKKEHLKDLVLQNSGNRNCKGYGFKLFKSMCEGRVDYKTAIDTYIEKIKQQYPNLELPPFDVAPYRKNSFTKWSIRDIEKK